MIDLAQADRTMRKAELPEGIYKVIHENKTVLADNLTWRQAAKVICDAYPYSAQMIRTN